MYQLSLGINYMHNHEVIQNKHCHINKQFDIS